MKISLHYVYISTWHYVVCIMDRFSVIYYYSSILIICSSDSYLRLLELLIIIHLIWQDNPYHTIALSICNKEPHWLFYSTFTCMVVFLYGTYLSRH